MTEINERFTRWQDILVKHSSYVNNLLLTMAVVVIGFVFSILDKIDFNPTCIQKMFLTGGLIFLIISLLAGGFGLISRLGDYRATLNKIRIEKEGKPKSEEDYYRCLYKIFGDITWCMFYVQSTLMLVGLLMICAALFTIYGTKLF